MEDELRDKLIVEIMLTQPVPNHWDPIYLHKMKDKRLKILYLKYVKGKEITRGVWDSMTQEDICWDVTPGLRYSKEQPGDG
jgi:hypothetical protein